MEPRCVRPLENALGQEESIKCLLKQIIRRLIPIEIAAFFIIGAGIIAIIFAIVLLFIAIL